MLRVRGLVVLAGVLGVTSVALAAPPPWSNSRHNRDSGSDYDYAPVTRVEPIVRQVRIETPRRECYDDVRYVDERPPQTAGRALLGGIIGGVIGHQIGSGRGNDAATVAGAVIGAGIGADSARREYGSRTREERVERCNVRYEHEYEERIDGYRVTYEYNGREYTTRMPYDPGERIKVRVAVAPAE
jgi:uncharacterized protein YcfJ